MCGRYATTRSSVDLSALFEALDETGGDVSVDYNLAPTNPAPVVRISRDHDDATRELIVARWGLVPRWAKDAKGAARMINARAETVATSRAFGPSFATKRCLVPADGWFEWCKTEGGKQPYFMTSAAGEALAFAGVWARWTDRVGFAIITTDAVGRLAQVHDRMPLLMPPQRWEAWLSGPAEPDTLLIPPAESWLAGLEIRPVGKAVGNVRNDGPALVDRVDDAPALF